MWPKLPCPKSSMVIDELLNQDDIFEENIMKTINTHLFNQNIQIVIGLEKNYDLSTFKMGHALHSLLIKPSSDSQFNYYHIRNMPLYLLLVKAFIDVYVKQGKVFAISQNDLDDDDLLALSSSGTIQMSLTEKTYHRLGLQEVESILSKKTVHKKHCVRIDLNSRLFNDPEKSKFYRRTYNLIKNSNLTFDIVLRWEPNSPEINPASIANYFHLSKTQFKLDLLTIDECEPTCRHFQNRNTALFSNWTERSHDISLDLIEWLGAQLAAINCHPGDHEVSSYGIIDRISVTTLCFEVSGFFTPTLITILKEIKNINAYNSDVRFSALIVNGFQNAITSWEGKNNEHGNYIFGENLYGIFFSDEKNFIWRSGCELDFGIEKL